MDIYDCIDKNGKFKTLHSCITCGFVGGNRSAYRAHKRTYKHKYNMTGDEKYKLGSNQEFKCEICNFECKKHGDYTRHLDTMKHKINVGIEPPRAPKKKEKKIYLCKCGNKYKSRSGLWTHEKKCKVINNKPKVNEEMNELKTTYYKQYDELKDAIKELIQMKDEQIELVRVKDEKIRKLEEENKSLEKTNKSLLLGINALSELLGKYK
jgi:hypothetical protein